MTIPIFRYGRRIIFLVSYIPFVVWSAATVGATNITELLFFRFLEGKT